MKKTLVFCLATALCLVAASAYADMVTLKNDLDDFNLEMDQLRIREIGLEGGEREESLESILMPGESKLISKKPVRSFTVERQRGRDLVEIYIVTVPSGNAETTLYFSDIAADRFYQIIKKRTPCGGECTIEHRLPGYSVRHGRWLRGKGTIWLD